jgi:aspartate dehydrogenase
MESRPLRVGVIGVGSIGRLVAEGLHDEKVPGACLHVITGRPARESLPAELGCLHSTAPSELPRLGAQAVVEAAGLQAARDYVPAPLEGSAEVVLMSIGALADPAFREQVAHAARASGRRVHLPSGGIAGLDGARAAVVGALDEVKVTITTQKAPASLHGAPYLATHAINLEAITQPTMIFEGSAAEAIASFPTNVNVAVALGLAVGDPGAVRVRLIVEPG